MYIYNDGGKSNSKTPKQKRDCVIRAIAITFNMSYDNAYQLMKELGRKSNGGTPKPIWQKWINSNEHAVKHSFPAIKGKNRMTLQEFCYKRYGKWFVQMAGHATAVIDGIVMDTESPCFTKCVYVAWKIA